MYEVLGYNPWVTSDIMHFSKRDYSYIRTPEFGVTIRCKMEKLHTKFWPLLMEEQGQNNTMSIFETKTKSVARDASPPSGFSLSLVQVRFLKIETTKELPALVSSFSQENARAEKKQKRDTCVRGVQK